MAVVTISRLFGSMGDEIARRVCEELEYSYFDKRLMAQVATEVGLSENEIVDFSESDYKVRSFWQRLLGGGSGRSVAQVRVWREDKYGVRTTEVAQLDENQAVTLVQATIQAAYAHNNFVLVGRGGQVILHNKPDAFHVRLEAPMEMRIRTIAERENVSEEVAEEMAIRHDQAAERYIERFYDVNWAEPLLYHLMINTGKVDVETATKMIVTGVKALK